MKSLTQLKVEYQYKRKPEYPSLEEQLDLLWHAIDKGKLNKTSDFYKKLKAVKENNRQEKLKDSGNCNNSN